MWNIGSLTSREWLLFEYIQLCIMGRITPSPELVWLCDSNSVLHTDWNQVYPHTNLNEWCESFKQQIETIVQDIQIPYDSAPWSFHSCIHYIRSSIFTPASL